MTEVDKFGLVKTLSGKSKIATFVKILDENIDS